MRDSCPKLHTFRVTVSLISFWLGLALNERHIMPKIIPIIEHDHHQLASYIVGIICINVCVCVCKRMKLVFEDGERWPLTRYTGREGNDGTL